MIDSIEASGATTAVAARSARRVPPSAIAGAVYLAAAVVLYEAAWTGGPGSKLQGQGGDVAIFVWSMRWVAYALVHGHNPLFSTFLNYPPGVNLLDNTSVALLGLLSAPLTLAAGAVVSFNVFQTLALALSAMSAYALLRRWTRWWPVAFAGGLLYGFSPYMIAAGWGHLHLTFAALIPLIFLCLDELLVRQRGSPKRWGIATGIVVACQLLVSSEMLADTVELTLIGVLVLALEDWALVRAKLRHAAVGLAWAGATAVVLLAYPLWLAVAGPEHGRIQNPIALATLFSSDLLEPIVPTSNQLIAPHALAHTGDRLSGGLIPFGLGAGAHNVTNAVYLGLPLVLILIVLVFRYRRDPAIKVFAPMSVVAFILALGPSLKVNGHDTGVWLPERLLHGLPLLEATIPLRYGMFVTLGAAVMLAIGIERLREELPQRRGPRRLAWAAPALLALSLLPLLPKRPYTMVRLQTPRFFTSAAVRTIPAGSVVLTYPPPGATTSVTMEWQAAANMRYRMVGAYMFARYDHQPFSLLPNQSTTERVLEAIAAGVPLTSLPGAIRRTMLAELAAWRVRTVLVVADQPGAATATRLFTELLERRPRDEAGVMIWPLV